MPMLVYTAVFFALTYFFSLKPSKVIDIVGKFMTPLLLLSIFIIFIAAWLNPLGPIEETSIVYQNGPFIEGLLQGYLALMVSRSADFAIIMINTFKHQRVTEHKQVVHYTVIVGVVAVVLLCLVYGALCFVGAQTSGMTAFSNGGVILNYAVYALFGCWGNLILGVAVVLACSDHLDRFGLPPSALPKVLPNWYTAKSSPSSSCLPGLSPMWAWTPSLIPSFRCWWCSIRW